MADGTRKRIEDIEVGDKVIATDPETGEQVAKRVERVFVHDDTVIDLVVDGEVSPPPKTTRSGPLPTNASNAPTSSTQASTS